jgi:hypothetical protein
METKYGFIYQYKLSDGTIFIGSTENINSTKLSTTKKYNNLISFDLLEMLLFSDKQVLKDATTRHITESNPSQIKPISRQKKHQDKKTKCIRNCLCGKSFDFNCKQVYTKHLDTTQHEAFDYMLKRIYILRTQENWTIKDCFRYKKKFTAKMKSFYVKYYPLFME